MVHPEEARLDKACPRRLLNVLLVEDDDVDARIIRLVADEVEGFEIDLTRVNTLMDAQAAVAAKRFDICLLDYWLGRESSLRFLAALEQMHERIGTVVISNISAAELCKLQIANGKNYFLPKMDCMPRQLTSAIAAVLPPGEQASPSPQG